MRAVSLLALMACSVSLAACGGGAGSGAGTLAENLDVCGLSCDGDTDSGSGSGGGSGGSGGGSGGGTGGGGTGSTGGGNSTGLSTGDTTIALETSKYVKPTEGTSLSVLSSGEGKTAAQTTAQILSGTKPTQLQFSIDTKTASNSNWATPVYQDEYLPGTLDPDEFGAAKGGAGGAYREYRALSAAEGRDELLQVWAWDNAYALQYRNASSGGEAVQQAWAFGGNATTAMPLAGSATYTGRFVATAKTSNWAKPDGADIDPNNLWRVQGASSMTANFGSGAVSGQLSPETWTGKKSDRSDYTWNVNTSVATPTEPKYTFYDAKIALKGTIDSTTKNTYSGTTKLNGDFVSGDNVMYGGFYGAGAAESVGIFNVYGVSPDPIGGADGINDDARGFLTINGAFHGDCQAGGACTP